MAITNGQAAKVRTLNKGKMGSYTAPRLIQALRTFMSRHHSDFSQVKKDKDLREKLNDIVEELGIRYPAGWEDELMKQEAKFSYPNISGSRGHVPAYVVEDICKKWPVSIESIQTAINKNAAQHGDNGVKVLSGGSTGGYSAELKIMSMGDFRVFSTKVGPFVFDKIARGLH